jgi:hypothetical protein
MTRCQICGEEKQDYLRAFDGVSLWQCPGCDLLSARAEVGERMTPSTTGIDHKQHAAWTEGRTLSDAFRRYLEILKERDPHASKVILVAAADRPFRRIAEESGMQVSLELSSMELEGAQPEVEPADAVLIVYQLERSSNPDLVLRKAHGMLRPGGTVLLVIPSLDSRSARLFGESWTEWRPEVNWYFDNNNIQSLLWKSGFNELQWVPDTRWFTLSHIHARAAVFPKTGLTRSIMLAYRILPSRLHEIRFRLPTSGIVLSARKAIAPGRPLLSIVVPVYNESSTFPMLFDELARKQIDGVDKEIVVIESNSSDNSRQLVLAHQDDPGVKVILQGKARGKGNAVREGLGQATGDVVLIQDADLEYDLNDYEALLEPVVSYKRPFVLGSRHAGRWKMRRFNDAEHLSVYFNMGHVLFTMLLNLLYGQHMKDPFTMFKVFRRDCLHNLKLECNRFDFDFELVIKLIRKGYTPLEIPVNYNSRSFKEGKKVNMFWDPWTWLVASFKYRFSRITDE